MLEEEIQLHGQANDALHGLRMALVDKAILLWTDAHCVKSQATTTRAWSKVTHMQHAPQKHAMIYHCARCLLETLGADSNVLAHYQPLLYSDLKVTSAVTDPNSWGQRNSTLAWFWSTDIPGDTEIDSWMNECEFYGHIVMLT